MTRLQEIEVRMTKINEELDGSTGEALAKLETEFDELKQERDKLTKEIETKKKLREQIAADIIPAKAIEKKEDERMKTSEIEARANKLVETGKTTIDNAEVRSVLISGGTLATPTGVDGIYDVTGARVSSIVDMVNVVNCVGMGSNLVAYITTDAAAADNQTEGETAATKEPTFAYKTISPTSVAVLSYISDQAKKQSPLLYEAKVRTQALLALRKNAAAAIVAKLKASDICATVTADLDESNKGEVNEHTLRDICLAYGGDESVVGNAVLFLNKTDLLAFGDVRGTNEKGAVYEITPDTANPNTGTIKDGGLAVKYCIVSGLTACSGTAQTASAKPTMFYGQPKNFELDLFSDYEIRVSDDFAFDKRLTAIRGSVDIGGDVVVKNGFVALTIASNA